MRVTALIFLLFVLSVCANHPRRSCKHDNVMKKQLEGREQEFLHFRESSKKKMMEGNHQKMMEHIRIPVVWHVLSNGPDTEVTDAQIEQEMVWLNDWFSARNTYHNQSSSLWTNVVATADDFQISFELAALDPDGNPTTGINRKVTSIADACDENNVYFSDQGGVDLWNPLEYYNIYTCFISDGSSGFAFLPESSPHPRDGAVLTSAQLGDSFYTGSTISHETGHYLGLDHTFGKTNNCGSNDLVSDTPTTDLPAFEYNTFETRCPPFTTDGANQRCGNIVQVQNNMDYNEEDCLSFFTKGQVELMRFWLTDPDSVRKGLSTSPALSQGDCPNYNCENKACGDDGCGGVCGICAGNCVNFICVIDSTPSQTPVSVPSPSPSGQAPSPSPSGQAPSPSPSGQAPSPSSTPVNNSPVSSNDFSTDFSTFVSTFTPTSFSSFTQSFTSSSSFSNPSSSSGASNLTIFSVTLLIFVLVCFVISPKK